jgi:hypothetical protein
VLAWLIEHSHLAEYEAELREGREVEFTLFAIVFVVAILSGKGKWKNGRP